MIPTFYFGGEHKARRQRWSCDHPYPFRDMTRQRCSDDELNTFDGFFVPYLIGNL